MMKKECRVVIYKRGAAGQPVFWRKPRPTPDKMSQFLSSYTREGWEVKTMSVERRRAALFWSRKRIFSCSNAPLTACAWFTRLSRRSSSACFQGRRI